MPTRSVNGVNYPVAQSNNDNNSVAVVRELTIPAER
jgi:hypothetical protein